MTVLQAIILGIVQGLTEFLPISSSAHLVIVPHLFGWTVPPEEAFIFDVLVQLATLLAVIVYFWKDLMTIATALVKGLEQRKPFADSNARLGWLIIIGTIPAGLFGILVKDLIEAAFNSLIATGIFLCITALMLWLGERFGKQQRTLPSLGWVDAVWVGVFQALAVFPGISRSGSTITGGMLRDLDRVSAARFSFLLSIPIMIAAGLLASLDLANAGNLSQSLVTISAGFAAAAVTGYISIRWLLRFLMRRPISVFSIYCLVAGMITILISLAGW